MPRPTSSQLHRAKKRKQSQWHDTILCLVDRNLAEALELLDAVEVVRNQDRERITKMVDRAARRVHASRLILRNYIYDEPEA
jgi:hypothetical protein